MASSRSVAVTQLGHIDLARSEFIAARRARQRGDFEAMVRHGEASIRAASELEDDFAKRVGVPPRGPILVAKWHALDLLGRNEEALATAEWEVRQSQGRDFGGQLRAADSAEKLGRIEVAGGHVEDALRIIRSRGGDDVPLSFRGARLLNAAARKREAAGQQAAARVLYSRSFRLVPDRNRNPEAAGFLFR
jgi:tetratricopeptide (TPR) repeat protein